MAPEIDILQFGIEELKEISSACTDSGGHSDLEISLAIINGLADNGHSLEGFRPYQVAVKDEELVKIQEVVGKDVKIQILS